MLHCFQRITRASYDSKNQPDTKREKRKVNALLGLHLARELHFLFPVVWEVRGKDIWQEKRKGKKRQVRGRDLSRYSPSRACNNGSMKTFRCFQNVSERCSKALYENRTFC